MKSGMVNIFWHPWEWTMRPWLRYFTASYEQHLSGRFSLQSQMVVKHPWYQQRWGHRFPLKLDAAGYWTNNQGGSRFATTPKSSGTGEHGHRIVIDDPVRAGAAEAGATFDLKAELTEAKTWYDGTVSSRFIDTPEMLHARILIMQRLFNGMDQFLLLAVPLFMLAGELMNAGGLTTRLINLSQAFVGHVRGSLALVNLSTNMLMAGISGSAMADA